MTHVLNPLRQAVLAPIEAAVQAWRRLRADYMPASGGAVVAPLGPIRAGSQHAVLGGDTANGSGGPNFAPSLPRVGSSGGTAFGTDADVTWPMEFLDPIMLEPMDDPVRTSVGKCRWCRGSAIREQGFNQSVRPLTGRRRYAAIGCVYDRSAITAWLGRCA